MRLNIKYLAHLFLFVLIFSCQKFSWHNPFDPECPKDLFTPDNFTAQQESKAIRISWQQSNTQISGFEILRSVDGGNNTQLVSLGKEATSYLDTDVQADKQYKYFIVAKAGDNKSNELSTVIVFKVQPPLVPENLNATVVSTSKVQLQWVDRSTEETGFKIERKTVGSNYGLIATLNANTTAYTDSTVVEGQTYFYRVYAFNQGGNSATYSNEVEVTILLLPQVTTAGITNITINAAVSGGTNLIQNGSSITAKGIVWSTVQQPTIALSTKTNNGSGSANYSGQMTGLTPGTTYYVRAYVTNQVGTSYGNEISFSTTQATLPTLSTTAASNITLTTAQTGGNITNDGGFPVLARGVVWSLMPQPTIALSTKTNDGNGSGVFTSNLTGLANGTVYFARAYATTQLGTAYGADVSFTTEQVTTSPDVVTIGTQVWQSKNLDVVTYRNGDIIPQVTDRSAWGQLTTGAWCWYANNSANGTTYGRLYNWYAVNDPRGLAPAGYHIPTEAEWTTLTNFLGGASVAGGKMKSTTNWQNPNIGATNSSGFMGLPGGYRATPNEDFNQLGVVGKFWSSTGFDPSIASSLNLVNNSGEIYWILDSKGLGASVRCIKD
jgi:hypothetical protein